MSHLGADLAAFVDGELDHPGRERVLRHLARCADCRAEVDEQRRVQQRLRAQPGPDPEPDLSARLRALAASTAPGGPAGRAPAGRLPAGSRTGRRRAAPRRVPLAAVGSAALVLGVVGVLVLGGPDRPGPTRAPVDPGGDALLVDFAGTAGELQLPRPVEVSPAETGR